MTKEKQASENMDPQSSANQESMIDAVTPHKGDVVDNDATETTTPRLDAKKVEFKHLPTRAELAATGLNKRNQEFVYQAAELVTDEKLGLPLIQKIYDELLVHQKQGRTAKQIYGTPEAAMGIQVEALKHETQANPYADSNYWDLAVDNMLTFLMLFAVMFGITLLFQKDATVNAGAAGVTSLALTSIIGGLIFALITKIMARQDLGRFMRIMAAILAFVLWFMIYMLVSLLPAAVNPVLSGWFYLVVSAIAFFGFRAWRKRTGIVGGFMGASQAQNRK